LKDLKSLAIITDSMNFSMTPILRKSVTKKHKKMDIYFSTIGEHINYVSFLYPDKDGIRINLDTYRITDPETQAEKLAGVFFTDTDTKRLFRSTINVTVHDAPSKQLLYEVRKELGYRSKVHEEDILPEEILRKYAEREESLSA
jgi:hypothetical protein